MDTPSFPQEPPGHNIPPPSPIPDPDEAPDTPTDEPKPPPRQDPPSEPDPQPLVTSSSLRPAPPRVWSGE
jgi:hypothetical protein